MENVLITGFLRNTPRLTRAFILTIAAVNLLVYLGAIYPHQLTYSRYYIPKLQLHRIFTSFLYFGQLNLEVALHILFLYRYSSMLEESCHRTSDYFYLLLLVSGILFAIGNVYHIPLYGSALSSTITYIWTRRNPQAIVQIMGFVSFYAFYLPFIVPITTLIFEGKISIDETMGILVGHLIFYFKDVYPRFGRNFLATPCWCHRLFREPCESCRSPRRRRQTIKELKKDAHAVQPTAKEDVLSTDMPLVEDTPVLTEENNEEALINEPDIQIEGDGAHVCLGEEPKTSGELPKMDSISDSSTSTLSDLVGELESSESLEELNDQDRPLEVTIVPEEDDWDSE